MATPPIPADMARSMLNASRAGKTFPPTRTKEPTVNSCLYIGATGLTGLSQGMQVITNNVANVSTIGFKQQDVQFSDMMYTTQAHMGDWWLNQEDSRVAVGQAGHGLQVETVRTIFTQGAFESSNSVTDLAINGRGFFQVTDGTNLYYTRAGDFSTDNEGYLRNPEGLALNGYKINTDGSKGDLQAIQIDKFGNLSAKASSEISLRYNLGIESDLSSDAANPFFSLLGAYNAEASPPISNTQAYGGEALTLYAADGSTIETSVYFDNVSTDGPDRVVEYLVSTAAPVSPDGTSTGESTPVLMGTLTFDSSGQLKDMSAFVPTVDGSTELTDWVPATIVDGHPQMTVNGAAVTVDFGLTASGTWQNTTLPATAADVGTDAGNLPTIKDGATKATDATVAQGTSGVTAYVVEQDGYPEGQLSYISIGSDGIITGHYSNNQDSDLWQIPVARFHNQAGLRREGNNLYSAGPEVGEMVLGDAGTENFGEITAYNIEMSNVDLATEMVNLIITQRGFQSNSKVVTTADAMLQKAIELKRN
jgi:flagellar hook protein FlgE